MMDSPSLPVDAGRAVQRDKTPSNSQPDHAHVGLSASRSMRPAGAGRAILPERRVESLRGKESGRSPRFYAQQGHAQRPAVR